MRRAFEISVQIFTVLVILAIVTGVYYYLAYLPPPPTTPYNRAKLYFMGKDYEESINTIRPYLKTHPDDEEAQLLYAQALIKNKELRTALSVLQKLQQKNPKSQDILFSLGEAYLASDRYEEALGVFEQLKQKKPKNSELNFFIAETYFQGGNNVKAAETYQFMIEHNIEKQEAEKRFLDLYGLSHYEKNTPLGLDLHYTRPAETQVPFRSGKMFLEVLEQGEWKPVLIKGMNLSGAAPGYYVANPPSEYEVYVKWFQTIADMNCNVVRVYTLCPPAFYQALKDFNEKSGNVLWLFQEFWLHVRDPQFHSIKEAFNLFDPSWTEEFKKDIREFIDVIHGRGDIAKRKGRTAGIYTADVSPYTIAIGLGKEVETYIATATNEKNAAKTSFKGQFLSVSHGNPTEVWFAEMTEYTIQYEMNHYNAQRPITIVNAPQFDSLYHPSESSFKEQHHWEDVYKLPRFQFNRIDFESDVTELDIQKYQPEGSFKAGFFACYHNYPHWPDFMWADQKYAEANDRYGPNPFWGYLLELKQHHPNIPLVLGEYGVSTSWAPVYNTIHSINQGGYTFQEQADIMTRWTHNLVDAGYAGGIVFEFQDEWWHTSVNLVTFMNPETKPLWFNVLDGESNYGVETYYAPSPMPLLRGDKRDWKKAIKMASTSLFHKSNPGDIKRVYATSDFAYLYLRLDLKPWENGDWQGREYWIALSTLPGRYGAQLFPQGGLTIESGFNFMIHLQEHEAKLLIAQNYNPFEWTQVPAILGGKELVRKNSLAQSLSAQADFEEILLPTQTYHIGREGTIYPALYSNWSELSFGTADPMSPAFTNKAACHISPEGMVEFRIPWMALFVIDPPNRSVMADLIPGGKIFGTVRKQTPGIGVVAISSDPHSSLKTLPTNDEGLIESGDMPIYSWKEWVDPPPYEVLLKPIYFSLKKLFKTLDVASEEKYELK